MPAHCLPIYDNVVALVPKTRQPSLRHVHLTHLDGRLFATAGFLPGLASAPWSWICEVVAAELECNEEDVGCQEANEDDLDGDFVTVDGIPAYRVAIGRSPRV
jgi:hypothetical protein